MWRGWRKPVNEDYTLFFLSILESTLVKETRVFNKISKKKNNDQLKNIYN